MKNTNIEKRLKNAIAKFRKESQNLKTKKAKKQLMEKLLIHIFKDWQIEKIPQTFLNCQIVCRFESSRNGFKHICEMLYDDFSVRFSNKRFYLNRTWERFQYESVFKEMAYKFARQQLESEI